MSAVAAAHSLSLKVNPARRALTPWAHQERALEELEDWYGTRRNGRRFLLHIATAGGKTFTANELVARKVLGQGARVLWVAKNWHLLQQACQGLCERHEGFDTKVARLGGANEALRVLPNTDQKNVVYTTLQTARGRLDKLARFDLIVWDECHWAAGTKRTGKRLLAYQKETRTRLLGLTGTSTAITNDDYHRQFHRDFSRLVSEEVVAPPRIEAVPTGVPWGPRLAFDRDSGSGDFIDFSDLTRSRRRTNLVVERYLSDPRRYGKAFVFACTVEHAEALRRAFDREDVPAAAVHYGKTSKDRAQALAKFKRGEVVVLIGVNAIAEGVDVPDVRSVFIARPTTSEVRYRQMVGRGARRTKTKTEFFVVDFVDNLRKHQDKLLTGRDFLPARRPSERMKPVLERRVVHDQHAFDDTASAHWTPDASLIPGPVADLWYRRGQTFGVEFELTREGFRQDERPDDWPEVAQAIEDALVEEFGSDLVGGVFEGHQLPDSSFDKWWVHWDSTAGWEVTTPILSGREGFETLHAACEVLGRVKDELGLHLNHRTGTHVHFGWAPVDDLEMIRRGILLARAWEPTAANLVAPSRVHEYVGWDNELGRNVYDFDEPNVYCEPISKVFPKRILEHDAEDDLLDALEDRENRYVSVNFTRTVGTNNSTVEVRLLNGTLDAGKIALWISLWQQILFSARSATVEIPVTPDVDIIERHNDLASMASELPAIKQGRSSFLERLMAREAEVDELWANALAA